MWKSISFYRHEISAENGKKLNSLWINIIREQMKLKQRLRVLWAENLSNPWTGGPHFVTFCHSDRPKLWVLVVFVCKTSGKKFMTPHYFGTKRRDNYESTHESQNGHHLFQTLHKKINTTLSSSTCNYKNNQKNVKQFVLCVDIWQTTQTMSCTNLKYTAQITKEKRPQKFPLMRSHLL